eukprot:366095-Chlamydomonas_euryale.AAC.2
MAPHTCGTIPHPALAPAARAGRMICGAAAGWVRRHPNCAQGSRPPCQMRLQGRPWSGGGKMRAGIREGDEGMGERKARWEEGRGEAEDEGEGKKGKGERGRGEEKEGGERGRRKGRGARLTSLGARSVTIKLRVAGSQGSTSIASSSIRLLESRDQRLGLKALDQRLKASVLRPTPCDHRVKTSVLRPADVPARTAQEAKPSLVEAGPKAPVTASWAWVLEVPTP